jgi:hypothetical protein
MAMLGAMFRLVHFLIPITMKDVIEVPGKISQAVESAITTLTVDIMK